MKQTLRQWGWLAGINLFISAFTFGGGYVVVPMVRKYYVESKRLFSEEELMEMAAVAQSTPGAIAINLSSLAGYRVAGTAGMVISCVCAVLPPLVILAVVSLCYSAVIGNPIVSAVLRGMQAGVAALIVDFVVDMTAMILKERSPVLTALVVLSFAISFFTQINIILVLLASCAVCAARVWWKRKGGRKDHGTAA